MDSILREATLPKYGVSLSPTRDHGQFIDFLDTQYKVQTASEWFRDPDLKKLEDKVRDWFVDREITYDISSIRGTRDFLKTLSFPDNWEDLLDSCDVSVITAKDLRSAIALARSESYDESTKKTLTPFKTMNSFKSLHENWTDDYEDGDIDEHCVGCGAPIDDYFESENGEFVCPICGFNVGPNEEDQEYFDELEVPGASIGRERPGLSDEQQAYIDAWGEHDPDDINFDDFEDFEWMEESTHPILRKRYFQVMLELDALMRTEKTPRVQKQIEILEKEFDELEREFDAEQLKEASRKPLPSWEELQEVLDIISNGKWYLVEDDIKNWPKVLKDKVVSLAEMFEEIYNINFGASESGDRRRLSLENQIARKWGSIERLVKSRVSESAQQNIHDVEKTEEQLHVDIDMDGEKGESAEHRKKVLGESRSGYLLSLTLKFKKGEISIWKVREAQAEAGWTDTKLETFWKKWSSKIDPKSGFIRTPILDESWYNNSEDLNEISEILQMLPPGEINKLRKELDLDDWELSVLSGLTVNKPLAESTTPIVQDDSEASPVQGNGDEIGDYYNAYKEAVKLVDRL